MSNESKKTATEIQDQDLDQAQGGVIINGDHRTIGRISANESSLTIDAEVAMDGENPFSSANGPSARDTIVEASGLAGSKVLSLDCSLAIT